MTRADIGSVDTVIRAVLGSLAIVLAALVADRYPVVALATGLGASVILATAMVGLDRFRLRRVQPPDGVPVRVLCPATGGTAVVRVAISVAQPALVVLACERFPDGVLRCDGECFPLDLMRRRPLSAVR